MTTNDYPDRLINQGSTLERDMKERKRAVYILPHYILRNKQKPPQDPEERKQFLALKQSITKLEPL